MKTALKSAAAGVAMSKEMAAMVPIVELEFEAQQQEDGCFKGLCLSGFDAIQIRAGIPLEKMISQFEKS